MSLSAIKRRIQVGTSLQIVHHDHPPIIFAGDSPERIEEKRNRYQQLFEQREVAVVQSNAIALRMPDGEQSWLRWPKAACVRSTSDGFEIDLKDDGEFAQVIRYEWR
jgi:hypothetical protein